MNTVPVADYLRHALTLKPEERDFQKAFADWLPELIIDAHAHCNLDCHVCGMADKTYRHMMSTFTHLSLEQSRELREVFYPGREVRSLRFPKTFRGIDHRAANDYLLAESPSNDRIAIFGLPEDPEYTTRMLDHPRTSALKMYWSYVEPNAEKIYDFFTPEILEAAQARNVPIILHLPKMIVRTIGDLKQVLADFPQLRVVLAHIGLSKLPVPGLEDAFIEAAKSDKVWVDTALNPSAEVVAMALRRFGTDRVMYGSDEPLNMIRSIAYQHPQKGERIVTDYQYHWVDPEDHRAYGHLAANAVHAQWQCMQAIRTAVEDYPASEQEALKRRIFSGNAQSVFGF